MKPLWLVVAALAFGVALQALGQFLTFRVHLHHVTIATVAFALFWFGSTKKWIHRLLQKEVTSKDEPLLASRSVRTESTGCFEDAPKSKLLEEALERRPKPRPQLRLARAARELVTSWVAILMAGATLVVNGQLLFVILADSGSLQVGDEVIDMAEMSIQLRGTVLSLLSQGSIYEIDCRDSGDALQLALAFKVLRAEASGKWKERPLDDLSRPHPAE
eukprot:symbB.v1.2.024719.t1/scaffold2362.1/size81346/2